LRLRVKQLRRSIKNKTGKKNTLSEIYKMPTLPRVLSNEYTRQFIPKDHLPSPKQTAFLLCDDVEEVFYGGQPGGGKSGALLMAALQWVDIPGYNALLLRDTTSNLSKPEGLLTKSHEWFKSLKHLVRWDGDTKVWHFSTGSTLGFGYLDGPMDHFNYQGPAYQFIGADELVQLRQNQINYLISLRMRRLLKHKFLPIRFRATSNPPTREQVERGSWVYEKYINPRTRDKKTVFIPASVEDNPGLDTKDYRDRINRIEDLILRKQMAEGDWNIKAKGRMFEEAWFPIVDNPPGKKDTAYICRFYDLAATEKSKKNRDPDYTAGVKIYLSHSGIYYFKPDVRLRKTPLNVERKVQAVAKLDGVSIPVFFEEEPGASGKANTENYQRKVLPGYIVRGIKSKINKSIQAGVLSAAAENGLCRVIRTHYVESFLDELSLYPDGGHDDWVDAASKGFTQASQMMFRQNLEVPETQEEDLEMYNLMEKQF